eukprot:TRINITY_DN38226_c0_g1_i1.p1 TRINITY_DN38226_c0_g1~~TRINITY_DN38226_c0_g1_i1.p1  ORF type:complete len:268 (+),score=59.70 TRINITY_DN38226_c0_g1_i1:60-863(+)
MAAPSMRRLVLPFRNNFTQSARWCAASARHCSMQRQGVSEDNPAGSESQQQLLWAPATQDDAFERLAGKIGVQCRNFKSYCVVGARGDKAVANALRSIARASELGKSPVEFRARWQEDPGDERSLRFYAEISETWSDFKKNWKELGKASDQQPKVLSVTPNTIVHKLATAVVMEQKSVGGAALQLNPKNDKVLSIGAKALATLPHLAQNEEIGCNLVCVLRWPSMKSEAAGKFIFAHVFWRKPDSVLDLETDESGPAEAVEVSHSKS